MQTWQDLGIEVPTWATGNVKTHCPKCHGGRRHRAAIP